MFCPCIAIKFDLDEIGLIAKMYTLRSYLFRVTAQKESKLRIIGNLKGRPPMADGFPLQRTSNTKMLQGREVILGASYLAKSALF